MIQMNKNQEMKKLNMVKMNDIFQKNYVKYQEIINCYVDDDGENNDNDDVDGLLDQIERLCRDVDNYSNKYFSTSQKCKKLKNENIKFKHSLNDLEDKHDRLKQEYLKLRQQNEDLMKKLKELKRKNRRNNPTSTGGGPEYDDNNNMDCIFGESRYIQSIRAIR